ncbi:4-hydroxy-tetrahydrodipicolinate synthase [Candidatus Epulonipiscium fishelsonii]|uniref:4-hydroxy-tetrahydrodipicolinate synthase n=1 Tax=Candidatus Epulonipiscium fishelsonii TaxID=77094 RepID=A0ACC8XGW2_9FIRM|nr:4-hydroxy-tetrahydrodipicolinate synthase [Epulopiscium sp. SCG-D08WGA-EpuloA1]
MKQILFKGSGVAIITPFCKDGIDFDKLGELLEFQVENNTDAIFVCGTTGETPTMTKEEQLKTIEYTVKKINGRIPVIAGAGGNNTVGAAEMSKAVEALGVDGLLSVVPYYNKPTQHGIYAHFKTIANSVKAPIILYNVPSRTIANMSVETIKELAKLENIVGIKECDFSHVGELVRSCPPDFFVYSGDDPNFLPLLSLGGQGLVSVMANIIPKDTNEIYKKFVSGDLEGSRKLQLKTLPLINALFIESNPVPLKYALNLMGYNVGECRLPLAPMLDKNIDILKKELKTYGLI